MTTISPQLTSVPMTLKYVEQSGVTCVSPMSTRMAKAVKAPRAANSSASHGSKSLPGLASEVDNGRLRHVVLEQRPERRRARRGVPGLELGKCRFDRLLRRLVGRR